jgi:hypothetical protein
MVDHHFPDEKWASLRMQSGPIFSHKKWVCGACGDETFDVPLLNPKIAGKWIQIWHTLL